MNKYSKVARYKINVQKSSAFLYSANNEISTSGQQKVNMVHLLMKAQKELQHRWQTQGLWAESGPPSCFI